MRTLKRRVHTVGVPRTPPYTCAPKKETRCSCASSHPCLRTTLRYRMDYQENRETQYPLERLSSRGSLEQILWSTTTSSMPAFLPSTSSNSRASKGEPSSSRPPAERVSWSLPAGAPPLRCWRNNAKHTSCGCRCM